MSARFFRRWIAHQVFRLALRLGCLHHPVVDADPADLFFTMPECFLAGSVALATPPLALYLGQLDELAIDAAPAQLLTMPESFFRRRVTLEALRLRTRLRYLDRFAVNADPARLAVPLRFVF